jgi:hypothetical protein
VLHALLHVPVVVVRVENASASDTSVSVPLELSRRSHGDQDRVAGKTCFAAKSDGVAVVELNAARVPPTTCPPATSSAHASYAGSTRTSSGRRPQMRVSSSSASASAGMTTSTIRPPGRRVNARA